MLGHHENLEKQKTACFVLFIDMPKNQYIMQFRANDISSSFIPYA